MRISSHLFVILILLMSSCKHIQTIDNVEILAKVKDKTLTREEVASIIPKGVTSTDSMLIAENYIKKWVIDELIYEMAQLNLGDEKEDIDNLVNIYRYSLFRYRYLERLIKERISADIKEPDKLKFYNENKEKLKLDRGIIKGLFLKIPIDAPKLHEVKLWYKSNTTEALGNIEQYSVQNAIFYDYFYDRWIEFDEVISKIPINIPDANTFLRNNKSLEVSDSSYCYLLNIKEYLTSKSIAPYDYSEPRIIEMLINQRKMSFLKDFESELFEDAVKNGDVIFNVDEESLTNVNKK